MSVRRLITTVMIIAALAAPQSAAAHNPGVHDGEVIADGSDVISNVSVSGGKARVNIQNYNDCPPGTSNCHIQIRWFTKCSWAWCLAFDDRSGWISVPIGQDFMQFCYNDGQQQWKVEKRLSWTALTTLTMETWGEAEAVLEVNGLVYNRMIGRFYAHGSYGYRHGTKIKTQTGTSGYGDPVFIATSGSTKLQRSC